MRLQVLHIVTPIPPHKWVAKNRLTKKWPVGCRQATTHRPFRRSTLEFSRVLAGDRVTLAREEPSQPRTADQMVHRKVVEDGRRVEEGRPELCDAHGITVAGSPFVHDGDQIGFFLVPEGGAADQDVVSAA